MAADPPGAARPAELTERLEAAADALGPDHAPRTRHRDARGEPIYVNRLIRESSPYLLQHAHNPVDWYPWGDAAFEKARAEDRPIFLSVGYATCHWCHVMEEESFDDLAVAEALNAHFVPVKLDREARPDLDQVYITATQMQNGHAGWPNSVFLRPDGAPFHTATYLPRDAFLELLGAVSAAWASPEGRAEIDRVADALSKALSRQEAARLAGAPPPGPAAFQAAVDQLAGMHNALQGGFSESRQFPQETFLLFLLDHWRRTGDEAAREMATTTLAAIAAGGIHDQAGGGFHRYAVDPNWRTPHFEKMLTTQAQLSRAFVEGWEATGRPAFRRAAERAFAYVLRDMTDASGAFFSAEDADSLSPAGEREEGAFYTWTPGEARAALGAEAERWLPVLGLGEPPTLDGRHVLHLEPGAAQDFPALDAALERLRAARTARPRPLADTKVIAGWNGLMIRALAEGATAFGDDALAAGAADAAESVWERLWDAETRTLSRLWARGRAEGAGLLEDHAWLGLGLLALHEATGEPRWAERAEALARAALRLFDDGRGRLRMAARDGPLGPVYDASDAATPAGESAALELLARLAPIAGDPALASRAAELRGALSGQLTEMPLMRAEGLIASRVLDEGRSTLRRTVGGGTVRVQLSGAGDGDWRLHMAIAPDWHVNAHRPGADWLIGARAEGAPGDWPEGDLRELGFAETPIRVYEGRVSVPLRPEGGVVTLRLQPCSETLCRDPVRVRFRLP